MTTKLAIVFPGQGSQSVGMLADLYAEFDIVKQTFTFLSYKRCITNIAQGIF